MSPSYVCNDNKINEINLHLLLGNTTVFVNFVTKFVTRNTGPIPNQIALSPPLGHICSATAVRLPAAACWHCS